MTAASAHKMVIKTFDLREYILDIPVLPGLLPENGDSKILARARSQRRSMTIGPRGAEFVVTRLLQLGGGFSPLELQGTN
jgi:hypothetical protein